MVSSVEAELTGAFNCLPGGVNAALQLRLGTFTTDSFSAPPWPASASCLCSNCVTVNIPVTNLPKPFAGGWPGYNYGGANDLKMVVANHKVQDICLSTINMTLEAVRVFPFIEQVTPDLASTTSPSQISIVADFINPDQEYSCFFNGNNHGYEAVIINSTHATCQSPILSDISGSTSSNDHASVEMNGQRTELSSTERTATKRDSLANTLVFAPSWASPSAKYNTPTTFAFYSEPTILTASPNKGRAGDPISIRGSGFVNSQYMSCKFGDVSAPAIFSNQNSIECTIPKEIGTEKRSVALRVSLNGQDSSTSYIKFQVEPSTSWWTSKKIAIVLGSTAGAILLLGVVISVVIYRRSRKGKQHSEKNNNGYRALPSLSLNSVPTDHAYGIDMKEVKIMEKIGRGSFGDIYKAEWHGTEVAVKKIPFNTINDDLIQEMLNEARIMESIRHPNVLSLMGCCPRPPEVCIIMEYMPRGSLYQILQDSRIPLSWQLIQRMALDAARGMNFLHQHNPIIMHRDLKSHNLLVDDAWRVKVADFGLSRMIEERVSATMTVCGTPCWTAPEVLRNQRYSVKADVYSFGICLWELYTRTAPYAGMTPFQVMFGVASSGMRPPIDEEDCPAPWRELMLSCWSEAPEERPTFDEIARSLQTMSLPETGGFH